MEIHKSAEDGDIYYFSNTTDESYNHHVLLRGVHQVEEWDPHSGTIRAMPRRFFQYKGELYTNVLLSLAPSKSVFFHTVSGDIGKEPISVVASIDHLQSDHAVRMSEF